MIERFGMDFDPGMEERVVSVHLPEDYEETDERYPVMYMFDGQSAFESLGDDCGGTWNLHRFLMRWDKPMIVAALESSGEGDRRMAEYSPFPLAASRWAGLQARGSETLAFVADKLKPVIDARFRTLPDRACTGALGGSMGALMSLYAVIARNDVFSKAACPSPALGECRGEMLALAGEAAISPDTRVYLSLGGAEPRDRRALAREAGGLLELANALMRRGARVESRILPEGRHCEADWSAQAPEFMRFLWRE